MLRRKFEYDLCLKPINVARSLSESICVEKVHSSAINLLVLGFFAGVFIAFGGELSTMVTVGTAKGLSVGISKFLAGSVFSVGLMLVVIAGAELFTGNNLVIISALDRRIGFSQVLRNWVIVYAANFVGAVFIAVLMYYSGLWKTGGNEWGATAATIAVSKVNLSFTEAFFRGIGCNWLVCLAVWMAIASRDVVGKIFAIYFPIMAFVASGFEHVIANMYFIPMGLFLRGTEVAAVVNMESLTWGSMVVRNFIPVTLGNVIGGAFFVGILYWVVYLRTAEEEKE
ncbi:MAG: formate/nitrite transporter family protein [Theionarchaea archaeon]|nr:MAG: FdhC protein [Theionarchaea archaeon DG-70-1]MBU7028138.1 formate/nitrite transporter family protein [Theionarchaea archaeon]